MAVTEAASAGEWVSVTLPDGTGRQDWVPAEQPASPDGGPGRWHIVSDPGGATRWEWHPQLPATVPAVPVYSTAPVSFEDRRRALAFAVQREVMAGLRVESQTDDTAVLVKGKQTNHILHLILTLLTCLIWGVVWLVLALVNQEKRVMLTVDPYGNVLRAAQ